MEKKRSLDDLRIYKSSTRKTRKFFKSFEESDNEETFLRDMSTCDHSFLQPQIVMPSIDYDSTIEAENESEENDSDSSIEDMVDIDLYNDPDIQPEILDPLLFSWASKHDIKNTPLDDPFDHTEKQEMFNQQLASWACKHNITHAALDDLLGIMQEQGYNIPSSSKTLLKTPRNVKILKKSGGDYFYFGLANQIRRFLNLYFQQ